MSKKILLLGLILSSCAHQSRFIKEVSVDESQRDDAFCKAQAATVQTSQWEYRGTFMEGIGVKQAQRDVFENCMLSKGYKKETK